MPGTFVVPTLSPPEKLDRDFVAGLAKVQGWRFTLAFGFDVLVIALAVAISEHFFFNPWVYLAAIFIIATRMHAFAVLFHDATHHRAYVSKRFTNMAGEFLGWSIFTTLEGYRNNHLTHHRHLNTEQDPDWVGRFASRNYNFPMTKGQFALELLRQCSGIGFCEQLYKASTAKEFNDISKQTKRRRVIFYLVVLAGGAYLGILDKLALYWVVPMMTFVPPLFYIRSVAGHHGNLEYDHTYTNARTTISSGIERFFFLPHGVGYHLDHHLYPHIPFYNIPRLHEALMRCEIYAKKAHVTYGLRGLLTDYLGAPKGPSVKEWSVADLPHSASHSYV